MSLSSVSLVVREEISWESIEPGLQDDRLLLIWSSSASDLVTYLKQKDERVYLILAIVLLLVIHKHTIITTVARLNYGLMVVIFMVTEGQIILKTF